MLKIRLLAHGGERVTAQFIQVASDERPKQADPTQREVVATESLIGMLDLTVEQAIDLVHREYEAEIPEKVGQIFDRVYERGMRGDDTPKHRPFPPAPPVGDHSGAAVADDRGFQMSDPEPERKEVPQPTVAPPVMPGGEDEKTEGGGPVQTGQVPPEE